MQPMRWLVTLLICLSLPLQGAWSWAAPTEPCTMEGMDDGIRCDGQRREPWRRARLLQRHGHLPGNRPALQDGRRLRRPRGQHAARRLTGGARFACHPAPRARRRRTSFVRAFRHLAAPLPRLNPLAKASASTVLARSRAHAAAVGIVRHLGHRLVHRLPTRFRLTASTGVRCAGQPAAPARAHHRSRVELHWLALAAHLGVGALLRCVARCAAPRATHRLASGRGRGAQPDVRAGGLIGVPGHCQETDARHAEARLLCHGLCDQLADDPQRTFKCLFTGMADVDAHVMSEAPIG
jgi:hypothetical protein